MVEMVGGGRGRIGAIAVMIIINNNSTQAATQSIQSADECVKTYRHAVDE